MHYGKNELHSKKKLPVIMEYFVKIQGTAVPIVYSAYASNRSSFPSPSINACHMCKSQRGLTANVKLHFLLGNRGVHFIYIFLKFELQASRGFFFCQEINDNKY